MWLHHEQGKMQSHELAWKLIKLIFFRFARCLLYVFGCERILKLDPNWNALVDDCKRMGTYLGDCNECKGRPECQYWPIAVRLPLHYSNVSFHRWGHKTENLLLIFKIKESKKKCVVFSSYQKFIGKINTPTRFCGWQKSPRIWIQRTGYLWQNEERENNAEKERQNI